MKIQRTDFIPRWYSITIATTSVVIILLALIILFEEVFEKKIYTFEPALEICLLIIFTGLTGIVVTLLNKEIKKRNYNIERLHSVLEFEKIGSWTWDIQQDKITWDHYMVSLFQTPDQIAPKNLTDMINLIDIEDRQRIKKEINTALEKTSKYECQYRIIYPDKSIHYIDSTSKIYRNRRGRPISMTGLCQDVTERHQANQALRDAKENAEHLTEKAEEATRLKGEFLANMSHELRTPLNSIIGFMELLHNEKIGPVTSEQKEYLGDILTSAHYLLDLINAILDLAKVEAGKMEFYPEPVDMKAIINEVRNSLHALITKKNIQVSVEIELTFGKIVLDPGRFKQILYNYVSNALKFTADGGRIDIRVHHDTKGMFRLEVEDNGIGIHEEDLKRLFTEFQQLDSGSNKQRPGTGLGLALTRSIVEAQGGYVGVTSTFGKGSIFYAILPYVPYEKK